MYILRPNFDAEQLPPGNSRRFYQEERDICNHMDNATSKLRMSKVDQENCSVLIEKWQKNNPGDLFFFRPYGTNISADSTWRPFYNEHCDNISGGMNTFFFRSNVFAQYWLKLFQIYFYLI